MTLIFLYVIVEGIVTVVGLLYESQLKPIRLHSAGLRLVTLNVRE